VLLDAGRRATKSVALLSGWPAGRRRGDFVALIYHRVGVGDREIDVPASLFARQIDALARKDRFLSMDEAVDGHVEGGCVITVDDGYGDFYETVLPVLDAHHAPVLLYLATGLVEQSSSAANASLTWDRLRDAVASGLVTVGSHTHNHSNLAEATESEAIEEMRRSKELVEDQLGVECRHFAYPWGVASDGARRAAASLFKTAALGNWKTNRRGRFDPLALGRTPVLRNDGVFFLKAKARGRLSSEALIYRALGRGPWGRS
jgi:peptidoglycan/xylan/chitin deacetylase (PgdA/CDA1 family)